MQGVLYSHRSNYLQSFTMSMPDACCLTSATTVLAIVPMVRLLPSQIQRRSSETSVVCLLRRF